MAKYTSIFEQAEGGSWGGYFPDLTGLLVNGATLVEAQENARTGLEFWMESMKEEGLPIPAPSTVAGEFEVERKLQTATSGVSAFFGIWPGEETDDQLMAALAEIRR